MARSTSQDDELKPVAAVVAPSTPTTSSTSSGPSSRHSRRHRHRRRRHRTRRTAYNRAVGRLGPAPPWATLSPEERLELTSERAHRFYERAIDPARRPASCLRNAEAFAHTIDRLLDLLPTPPPSFHEDPL